MFMCRARSAREIGWCSRTRFRRICRLISRGVERVALTNLRVSIFRTVSWLVGRGGSAEQVPQENPILRLRTVELTLRMNLFVRRTKEDWPPRPPQHERPPP